MVIHRLIIQLAANGKSKTFQKDFIIFSEAHLRLPFINGVSTTELYPYYRLITDGILIGIVLAEHYVHLVVFI